MRFLSGRIRWRRPAVAKLPQQRCDQQHRQHGQRERCNYRPMIFVQLKLGRVGGKARAVVRQEAVGVADNQTFTCASISELPLELKILVRIFEQEPAVKPIEQRSRREETDDTLRECPGVPSRVDYARRSAGPTV